MTFPAIFLIENPAFPPIINNFLPIIDRLLFQTVYKQYKTIYNLYTVPKVASKKSAILNTSHYSNI
jgi:hypothetical protein